HQLFVIDIDRVKLIDLIENFVMQMGSRIAGDKKRVKLTERRFSLRSKPLRLVHDDDRISTANNLDWCHLSSRIQVGVINLTSIFTASRKRLVVHDDHFDVCCIAKVLDIGNIRLILGVIYKVPQLLAILLLEILLSERERLI